MDFINLNKAYPYDSFHLSKIDKLVDSTIGFKFLSSLDANSGYHQIPMHLEDEKKTSFITRGIFCYHAMPFRLKIQGPPTSR